MDYSKITLGELLSSENETIKRHAVGILKQYQNPPKCKKCGYWPDWDAEHEHCGCACDNWGSKKISL